MVLMAVIGRGYLVDGRRVRVSDLVDAKLLAPGTRIRFRRPRIGDEYEASITEDGRIAAGGQTLATPSGAAVSLIGSPVDGWIPGGYLSTGRRAVVGRRPPGVPGGRVPRRRVGKCRPGRRRSAPWPACVLETSTGDGEVGGTRAGSVVALLAQWVPAPGNSRSRPGHRSGFRQDCSWTCLFLSTARSKRRSCSGSASLRHHGTAAKALQPLGDLAWYGSAGAQRLGVLPARGVDWGKSPN